jgi:uncharacterized membrane protein YphA (DoxX/SURF4 family)
VLLRVAIGWHFQYEGLWKINSWKKGDKPFTAEPYLRNATGPLAPYFRGMVPDVNGLAKLDPPLLKASWKDEVQRVGDHYGFNDDQRTKAAAVLDDSVKFADDWFHDRENREKLQKYKHDLGAVQKVERSSDALENEKLWAWTERKNLDTQRKDLTKELDARAASLREAVVKLATPEQAESAGPLKAPLTTLDLNNTLTAFGLVAIGFCMIVGLFTRLAALGGAAFLTLIYLSMPPWPGLPPNPMETGHYLIVDRNVVELLACLSLACLPTGHWVGIDALLFGWMRRSRELRAEREMAGTETVTTRGRTPQRVS